MNSSEACIMLHSQTTLEEVLEHIETFLVMTDAEISTICRTRQDQCVLLSVNETPGEIQFCRE